MTTRDRRIRARRGARRGARLLLTTVLAVAALTCVASAGSGVLTRDGSFVPDRSTPVGTVRAFVAAVQARAVDVAWEMVTPEARRSGILAAAIDDPVEVSDVQASVGAPRPGMQVDPQPGYREVADVRVTFFVHDRSGAGFGYGPALWGYRVVRNGPDEPWSVASGGV